MRRYLMTPWGRDEQGGEDLVRGVVSVSTAGHGGIGVHVSTAKSRLSAEARALGQRHGYYYWYEEDCLWAVVCAELPDVRGAYFNHSIETLRRHLARWVPQYSREAQA